MTSVHQTQTDPPQTKGGRKRNQNNVIYANPLPITFSQIENKFIATALGVFAISPVRVLNPRCNGTFDPITRSVWITGQNDRVILWRGGFFGKGNLSRSEPSWFLRQSNIRSAPSTRKPSFVLCATLTAYVKLKERSYFRSNLRGGDSEAKG
jgi:tRNA-splicing endonuclease subunit Sen2